MVMPCNRLWFYTGINMKTVVSVWDISPWVISLDAVDSNNNCFNNNKIINSNGVVLISIFFIGLICTLVTFLISAAIGIMVLMQALSSWMWTIHLQVWIRISPLTYFITLIYLFLFCLLSGVYSLNPDDI